MSTTAQYAQSRRYRLSPTRRLLVLVAAVGLARAVSTQAVGVYFQNSYGLVSPSNIVTFSEFSPAPNTIITTQYEASDLKDEATVLVTSRFVNTRVHRTNLFYQYGAVFGKSQAMEEARQQMPWQDWILFFDADILPPKDWYQSLLLSSVTPEWLYGVRRRECSDVANVDSTEALYPQYDAVGLGYFQLFHSSDKAVQETPLLKPFHNASGYDAEFRRRWPSSKIKELPFEVMHLGASRRNWCGKGNDDAMNAMWAERIRRGGWEHERIG